MINWHRLFGMALTDFFAGSPFRVELEKDLSLKQQFLDILVVRGQPGEFTGPVPDGFEGLAEHNLISYKSLREPLDAWAVDELLAHYVNYRKQVSESARRLLPESSFRLYGVSTRFPENLATQAALTNLRPGVHRVVWGVRQVDVLVLSEVTEEARNAIWNLFSGVPQKVAAGATLYRGHTSETSTIMNRLFEYYRLEGIAMPYTVEDFRRDAAREILEELPPEERLKGLTAEERLRGLPVEERLRGLTPEEIHAYLARLEKQAEAQPRH